MELCGINSTDNFFAAAAAWHGAACMAHVYMDIMKEWTIGFRGGSPK